MHIDGRYGDLNEAQNAILKSGTELLGAKMLLLSPQKPNNLHESITHELIAPLTYFEYGLFVIYALHQFISTEFALIVQNDGWVLNGKNWKEDFFKYDYIGAPIHLARVKSSREEVILRVFKWTQYLNNINYDIDIVMNGGFSLRSKRLLRAPQEMSLPFLIKPSQKLSAHNKLILENDSHLEDVQLCLVMKKQLEKNGIKFAPLNIAKFFSFEHLAPFLHKNFDLNKVLGHHGKLRRFKSLDPLEISYSEKEEIVNKKFGEKSVIELFKQYNYSVKFK